MIAAEIVSPKGATDKIHVIYAADTDILSDWFFSVRERKLFHLNLDNVTFVLNAVDHLAGDSSYIDLRKRRAKHRTLVKVEAETAKYIEGATRERQQAADEAKTALEDARKRLAEKVDKIKNDQTMDDQSKLQAVFIAQQEESVKAGVEETIINQRKEQSIEKSKTESDRNVRAVEKWYYACAIVASPIPAVLLGLLMWMLRVASENREIAPTRRRVQQ